MKCAIPDCSFQVLGEDKICKEAGHKCELCEVNPPVELYYRLWLCAPCAAEQKQVVIDIKKSMAESEGVATADRIERSREIDSMMTLREDIFNSESLSLSELIKLVNEDDRITNKNYRICELVQERIAKLRTLIFDENQRLIELNNRHRVNNQFLNEYANKLRAEEREKLKIQDKEYKPDPIKSIKPKLVSVKKKTDKELVKKCVNEFNAEFPKMQMTEALFMMIMTQKGRGPEDTLFDLRRKFKEETSANG